MFHSAPFIFFVLDSPLAASLGYEKDVLWIKVLVTKYGFTPYNFWPGNAQLALFYRPMKHHPQSKRISKTIKVSMGSDSSTNFWKEHWSGKAPFPYPLLRLMLWLIANLSPLQAHGFLPAIHKIMACVETCQMMTLKNEFLLTVFWLFILQ